MFWFSITPKCVTLLFTEAEYFLMREAVNKLLAVRQVWYFMLPSVGRPCVTVFEDNLGAVQLAQNLVTNSNSKHIGVRYHFLRKLILQGDISISHVQSAYQHASLMV